MMSIDTKTMQAGDHLVSKRFGYTHHGIYIGNEQVIHYAGFCEGFKAGKVEITSLEHFCQGKKTYIIQHPTRKFSKKQTLERAYLRLNENKYHLLKNNCEHFVHWCIEGKHHSAQVTRMLSFMTTAVVATIFSHHLKVKKLL